ncbi:pro-adrenomedullin [Epinephelus fuscoguttatus]|uniref:pro-adrenomedullin n=1 Tax=Epinephelus fuscoguttatus TaxID=293821 RepID=UPI0020D0E87D|nr:pro-adrenomedullin [Epinephelus fuscoguttatus]
MRLAVHTVICCCVFTTVLPLVKGATGELNTSLKKRFRVWLHSRMKRELCLDSSEIAGEQHLHLHAGQQQDENVKTDPSLSSSELNIRRRRSTSAKSSGCFLVTCAYHDLLHRLHQITNKDREPNAPEKKMGSSGYGRRRRSLLDVTQLALQTGRQRRSTEAASKEISAAETQCLKIFSELPTS